MSDAKVIEGRVYLIPPRGLLAKLENVIYEKVAKKKGFKYLGNGFEIPSRKMKFEIDVVVDDDCEVCPLAIEYVSEIAGKYENVITKFYNASYVDPPFSISATPAFRINNRVKFIGLPLDPESMNRYFMEFLKEAYVMTHPKLKWLIGRLQRYAEANGFKRNPNDNSYLNILYKLLKNIDEYGHPYCPCRPLRKVAGATPEKIYELNKDKVCPCPYAPIDIKKRGTCLCVPPDTIILGENKPINKIRPSDYTIIGGRVVKTWKRRYRGDLVVVKAVGLLPLKLTPEHPVLVVEAEWKGRVRRISKPFFLPASELKPAPSRRRPGKGHYLVVPIVEGLYNDKIIDLKPYIMKYGYQTNTPKVFPLNRETAWLMGLYVADGSLRPTHKHRYGYTHIIQIALSEKEHIEKAVKVIESLGLKARVEKIKNENCVYVLLQSGVIARMFKQLFGKRSEEKRIPDIILLHKDKNILEGFLEGLIDGDGHRLSKNVSIITTTSPYVAMGSQLIGYRLGYVAHIYTKHTKSHKLGNRIIVPKHPKHVVYVYRSGISHRILRLGNYIATPITNIEMQPYEGYVYNLTTENNVYLVSNAIVHNCGLFWSDKKVDEYIKNRVREYGWVIKEIERVQKALEELKKRVISGRGKILAESIINKLQEIYFGLPD